MNHKHVPDERDCAWCDAAQTLELLWTEMGVDYFRCSCCAKLTRVGRDGVSYRVTPHTEPAVDISGYLIDGP